MVEFVIAAVPLLLLVVSLLIGRYPGCEAAMRLAERLAARARAIPTVARSSSPPRPQTRRAPHGGLLIALSLAQRPPPLAA